MSGMDAFGQFDEGNEEFILQQPASEAQPAAGNAGPQMQEQAQFPSYTPDAQQQFSQPMGAAVMGQQEDDDLTEEEK